MSPCLFIVINVCRFFFNVGWHISKSAILLYNNYFAKKCGINYIFLRLVISLEIIAPHSQSIRGNRSYFLAHSAGCMTLLWLLTDTFDCVSFELTLAHKLLPTFSLILLQRTARVDRGENKPAHVLETNVQKVNITSLTIEDAAHRTKFFMDELSSSVINDLIVDIWLVTKLMKNWLQFILCTSIGR